jgi:hypothetical protein
MIFVFCGSPFFGLRCGLTLPDSEETVPRPPQEKVALEEAE